VLTHLLLPVPELPVGPTTLFDIVETLLPHPPDPPPLAVDPEPMRIIVPNQPEDSSGLDAMIEMPEGKLHAGEVRSKYFVLPLPPGIEPDAPELFGFWTYELRVGHKALWSTAQARFGRPLVVNGVQHPAPTLLCTAFRVKPADPKVPPPERIVVSAPFATAVFDDKRLTSPPLDPRSRMWVLLYAQVVQADGSARRNVLLGRAPALPRLETEDGKQVAPKTRDVIGVAEFRAADVEAVLEDLTLPRDTPLSVIAVELLPGDSLAWAEVLHDQQVFALFDQPEMPVGSFGVSQGAGPGAGADAVLAVGGLAANARIADPLGRQLGDITSRRILRCSPLTPVAPSC
jgi:hypothetical protein